MFGFFPMAYVLDRPTPSDMSTNAKPLVGKRDTSRKYIPRVERVGK